MKNYKDFFTSNKPLIPEYSRKNENVNHCRRSVSSHQSEHVPIFSNESKFSSGLGLFATCGENSDEKNFDCESWSSNSTGEFGISKVVELCCRTFFTQNEIISQPESDVCEFKAYTFPFNKMKIDTILKTMCGFLNWNGGHIYIGIEENITTKQHKVIGETYNEAEKEDVLRLLRVNAELIEPDILINNKMKICFVPVKSSYYPYAFIAGRFVIKIQIYPGVRDELYTLKTEEGEYFLCIRTENEVLTCDVKKDLRKILQIQKERAQNPLTMPRKLHKYECKKPEEGIRLFQEENRMLKKKKRNNAKEDHEDSIKSLSLNFSKIMATKNALVKLETETNNRNELWLENETEQSKNKSKIKQNKRKTKTAAMKEEERRGWENKVELKKETKKDNELKNKTIENMRENKKPPPQKPYKISSVDVLVKLEDSLDYSKEFPRFQQSFDSEKTVSMSKNAKYQQSSFCYNGQKEKFQNSGKSNAKEFMGKSFKPANIKEEFSQHENEPIKYFCRYAKCNSTMTTQDFIKFGEELKTINYSNHSYAALQGFSKKKIEMILSQFKNDSPLLIIDFESIVVLKFSKTKLGEKGFREALEKAISYQVNYSNTSIKRRNKRVLFAQDSHSTKANSVIQESSKESKEIIKLTLNLKINKYSLLSKVLKERINERISYVEKITKEKCVIISSFKKFDDSRLFEVVQFSFKNLCHCLIGFLELKELEVELIFC